MLTASVRVNPVPVGISVFRLTRPVEVEIKGTCLPGFGGWYWVIAKYAVPTTVPVLLMASASFVTAPEMVPRSVHAPLANIAAGLGGPFQIVPTITPLSFSANAFTWLAPLGTGRVVSLPPE